MTRSSASVIENNFVNGLVTEATALNFPESACTDTDNCVFNQDGSFERRKGFDFETGYNTNTVPRGNRAFNYYLWKNAAGSGNLNFVVLQVGMVLYFYKISGGILSDELNVDTVDLSTYLVGSVTVGSDPFPEQYECQFDAGKGTLFIVHPFIDPVYVTYNETTDDFDSDNIVIYTRDTDGLVEAVENDDRPSTLTDIHKYNLYNQGWGPWETGGLNDPRPTGGTVVINANYALPSGYLAGDPLSVWDTNRADFPSNSDVWWLFKDAQNVFQPKLASVELRGNSPAPKGHYILEAFDQDRSTRVAKTVNTGVGDVSVAIAGIPITTSGDYRPSAVAFFAGRVWYSGVNYQGFSNRLYFSQIITTETTKLGNCYQLNDPTSEHSAGLLPTDGGMVQILDCGTIVKLFAMQNILIIFANNGIWSITGSTGIGFTADDFVVSKVSSVPVLSASSFVDFNGVPVFWTADSIYAISPGDAASGRLSLTSLSEKKIKTFFNEEIEADSKRFAKGSYNPLTKTLQWCYSSSSPTSVYTRYEYDKVLCFNSLTQSFFPWSFDSTNVNLNGVVSIQGRVSSGIEESVTVGGVNVTVDAVDISLITTESEEISGLFKYIVSYSSGNTDEVTFAEEKSTTYTDFPTYSVNAYSSYVDSGYKLRGQAQKKFQSEYVYIYANADNGGGKFNFGYTWDYNTNTSSKEWGRYQLVDTTGTVARKYGFRKLKVNGRGMSVQFTLRSIAGQPFRVVGWSTFDTVDGAV